MDDFQEPDAAGSENRVQKKMVLISPLHSKLIGKIQQRRFSCLSRLKRQLCGGIQCFFFTQGNRGNHWAYRHIPFLCAQLCCCTTLSPRHYESQHQTVQSLKYPPPPCTLHITVLILPLHVSEISLQVRLKKQKVIQIVINL